MSGRRRWTAALALSVLLVLPACGSTDGDPTSGAARSGTGTAAGGATPDGSDPTGPSDPVDPGDPADPADPADSPGSLTSVASDGPFVVAASGVARRSRDLVLQLHAMAMATQPDADFPKERIAAQGTALAGQLRALIREATMAAPPRGSAAAGLVAALRDYRRLAGRIGGWDHRPGQALPDGLYRDLAATDQAWQEALRELGELSGDDLLEGLPPLLLP